MFNTAKKANKKEFYYLVLKEKNEKTFNEAFESTPPLKSKQQDKQ